MTHDLGICKEQIHFSEFGGRWGFRDWGAHIWREPSCYIICSKRQREKECEREHKRGKKMCKGQIEHPFTWSILRQKLPHPCYGTIDPFMRALTSWPNLWKASPLNITAVQMKFLATELGGPIKITAACQSLPEAKTNPSLTPRRHNQLTTLKVTLTIWRVWAFSPAPQPPPSNNLVHMTPA